MGVRVAIVVLGAVALVLPAPGNAVAGAALWAVGIVVWRWSAGVQRGIEVRWDGPVRVQPDATTTGVLTVRNRSRWPVPWLDVQLRLPANAADPHAFSVVTRLGGRRERRLPMRFVAGARGVHEPRQLSWRAWDPLGITTPSGTGVWTGATVVVPRLSAVRRLDPPQRSPLAQLRQPTSLFEDRTALVGVRAYERGDPLSSIHWQATAHTGGLMRTEYERAAARELLVCLDLSSDGYQRRGRPAAAEAAIGAAASLLADTVVRQRQQAGLALSSQRLDGGTGALSWPVRGADRHLHAMLDTLARVQLHDAVPIGDVVRRVLPGLHAGTSLVVITGMVDDALDAAVSAAQGQGLAVTVLAVGSGVEWESRIPLHVAGAPCVAVASDRSLRRLPL